MTDSEKTLKVLIVDSDSATRSPLSALIRSLGHHVIEASTIVQALSAIQSEREIEIAILDGSTADSLGRVLAGELRKQFGVHIYIILLTADQLRDKIEKNAIPSDVDDFLDKPFTESEILARFRLGIRMRDLMTVHSELRHILHKAASFDDLTGLWNRRMILEQLGRELNRARHQQQPLAVAIADIDRFKKVNDTYGHAAGDMVLRETAAALRLSLRSYDFVGRYGGEEFLILLPGCDVRDGAEIAQRLCESVARTPIRIRNTELSISVSIGISSTTESGLDSATVIGIADDALYRAKAEGGNRVAERMPATHLQRHLL